MNATYLGIRLAAWSLLALAAFVDYGIHRHDTPKVDLSSPLPEVLQLTPQAKTQHMRHAALLVLLIHTPSTHARTHTHTQRERESARGARAHTQHTHTYTHTRARACLGDLVLRHSTLVAAPRRHCHVGSTYELYK